MLFDHAQYLVKFTSSQTNWRILEAQRGGTARNIGTEQRERERGEREKGGEGARVRDRERDRGESVAEGFPLRSGDPRNNTKL
jgi:hypothetical protein